MQDRLIPERETCTEIVVVNSHFVATVGPAFTVGEARAFIDRIRSQYADASHNVPAYLIGHGASVVAHCHDDGEPSGTAGRPVLAVLRGSELGDVVMVVTRYFGGTRLGTGGLVRAYSDAAREVLSVLPRAVKVSTHTVEITAPYGYFERLRLLVREHDGQILREAFAAEVTVAAQLPVERFPGFEAALREMSKGSLAAAVLATDEATIIPIPADGQYQERGGLPCGSES